MYKALLDFKNRWIWKDRKPGPNKYLSVDDMFLDFNKKEAFLQEICEDIYYTVKRWWEKPGDISREIKWSIQRSERGWSDRDAWGAHYYIAQVVCDVCLWLRKNKQGIPTEVWKKNMPEGTAEKEWDRILDEIIWTFDVAKKIGDHDWICPKDWEKYTIKEMKIQRRYSESKHLRDMHWMTKDEIKRYNKGWKYFKKYFFNLWD